MTSLFLETERQLAGIRRTVAAMSNMPLVVALFLTGLWTSLAWSAGYVEILIGMLPGWAHMIVIMPLFGSMIAVYALGGFATLSLVISITADLALAPIRDLQRSDDPCVD